MEHIEGNKIIALFMGETVRKDGLIALKDREPLTGQCIVKAKYHTSWDWLMPVVEKIEAMEIDNGKFEVYIFKRCCDIQEERGFDHLIEVTAQKNKIHAVWLAVIEFINWYNKNTTNGK